MPATPHVRLSRAQSWDARPPASQTLNGDETRYADLRASYSKGLDHDVDGHVDETDFDLMTTALIRGAGGQGADGLDTLPSGVPNGRKLTSPKAGLGVELIGGDPRHYAIPPAPRFASEEIVAEIVENYWMARLRDVPFGDYEGHPLVGQAVADLTAMGSDFKGPSPSAQTLFRGKTIGEAVGPYISQFLMHRIPFGAQTIVQTMKTLPPNQDHLTTWDAWLAVQRGFAPAPVTPSGDVWIRNGRDIGQWVHVDQLYQAYFLACLFLLEYKKGGAPAFSPDNPYAAGMPSGMTQDGFATFGGPHILSLLTEVATRALKAVWYQKWLVHRRLRPEVFAARIHFDRVRGGNGRYDIDYAQLDLATNLVGHFQAQGSYLLPQAFPEGSPTHPAYGAGHATVAGACTTILKAWFDGSTLLKDLTDPFVADGVFHPLEATPAGGRRRYLGVDQDELTIEGELNKIAANIGIGRNIAGVHWRSDHAASIALGEQVAIDTLADYACTYEEAFAGFRLRRFDGSSGRVGKEGFRAEAGLVA